MQFDRFYGFGSLSSDTADAGARVHNARPPLSEAWRYPTRPKAELEAEVRRIVGPDARFETRWVAVCVTVARCEASDPERWAHELAALDTRVCFTTVAPNADGSTRFEAVVWVSNPHEGRAGQTRRRRELRWEPWAGVDSGACLCGAEHVAFYWNRKSQPGDELETVSTPCLACGRATLTIRGVNTAQGVEFYLLDRVPFDRVRRLRRDRAWRHLPLARRITADVAYVARELWVPAIFVAIAILLFKRLDGCR